MDFSKTNTYQEARIDISQIVALATVLCELDLDALNDEERRDLSARVAELMSVSAALTQKFNGAPQNMPTRRSASRYLAG